MIYQQRDHKWVYLFSEGRTDMKPLLGGKGANVAEMTRAGLPVPPGFTITTEACNAYMAYQHQFPEGMWSQAKVALQDMEDKTGRQFGNMVDPEATIELLTTGLPASPGAAAGRVVLDPDDAVARAAEGEKVILVRLETSPDDFHGMAVAEAIVTARGGMTSHAAVVARGMGTPCVVGAGEIEIDHESGYFFVNGREIRRGDWITIDGSIGRVLVGQVPTKQPEVGEHFQTLMAWADEYRLLGVRANADTGHDATVARNFGAQGIGLCRTEHMFFGEERLATMREMILADDRASREIADSVGFCVWSHICAKHA